MKKKTKSMKQRSMIYKGKIMITLFCWLSYTVTFGQSYSDNQTITRKYKVNASTTIDITNKYGKIHIVEWEKDSVQFEIELSARSSDMSRLYSMIEDIDFDFTETSHYISVKTIIGSERSGFISDLKKLARSFLSSDSQLKIDYTILIPSYVDLRIDNKYGDVYVDDIKGDLNLKVSNGDFKANNLKGNTEIDMKFCNNADVNLISNGRLTVYYSDININKADQLTINSKSSKLAIEHVDMIKMNSRSDKYHISNINFLYGETYFTDIWCYKLIDEISINTKYGDLNLEYISKDFSFINIDARYSDVNLFFERNSSYNVDINHTEKTLHFPKEISNLREQQLEEDKTRFLTYGTIGKGQAKSKVRVNAEEGVINIYHK